MNFLEYASNGDIEKMKECLENGADIEAKNKDGDTALIIASCNGDLEIVKYLVENGAVINDKDFVSNALIDSLFYEHIEIAEYLISKGGKK